VPFVRTVDGDIDPTSQATALGRKRRARAEPEAVLAAEAGHAGARGALAELDTSPRPGR